jgi:hypothetical protein
MLVRSDFNFRYGDAPRQLSAARVRVLSIATRLYLILTMQLWAIMLGNSSEFFVHQCAGRKFMDALEKVLYSQRTSTIIRERLLEVIAAAAYASSEVWHENESAFRALWQKVKPAGMPDVVRRYPYMRVHLHTVTCDGRVYPSVLAMLFSNNHHHRGET